MMKTSHAGYHVEDGEGSLVNGTTGGVRMEESSEGWSCWEEVGKELTRVLSKQLPDSSKGFAEVENLKGVV